jgi:hypothetical protein
MADVEIGRGIVNGGGNVVLTLASVAHKNSPLQNRKRPWNTPRA